MVTQKMPNKEGFTLIELLVVVAIIAILAAIAIPQYNKYRANAMLSNVQQFTKSVAKQASALATTAGQNPECANSSNFAIDYSNGYLQAYTYDGTTVGNTVCDKVKVYGSKPGWLDSVAVDSDNVTGYIILTNEGTSVTLDGYIDVKSNYKVGNYYFGCEYKNDNLTDINTTYLCHIK